MSLGPNFIGQAPSSELGAFSIVAHVTAKSESDLQEILALFLIVQKRANSNDEPDCTEYKILQAHDDPLSIVIYEQYNSIEALTIHNHQEAVQKLFEVAGAFITVANLTAKGEKELKILLSILSNVYKSANSDAEPDCIGYEAIQAHDDPLSIIVYEKYRSSEALEFHRTTEAFQAFAKQAQDLTSLRHIRFYKPLTP